MSSKIAVVGATGRVGHHVVELLEQQGHEVVSISRSHGIDVITGDGLAEALEGVDSIIDAATGPSPEEQAATEFFVTAAGNLQRAAEEAGAQRIVVISIVGTDRFAGGYGAAKVAHEQASAAGSVPVVVLRATQFHELVSQLLDWGRRDGVIEIPEMRTQIVAARAVAEQAAELATADDLPSNTIAGSTDSPTYEVAGPREEKLIGLARLVMVRRGDQTKLEIVSDPSDPEQVLYQSGGLLPGPSATLAGPTFEEWLQLSAAA